MREGPSLEYNQSIPASWWTSAWRPSQFAYGLTQWGQGQWGANTDADACRTNNVYCIIAYLKAMGWSFESIIAVCGNAYNESQLDPRYWQRPNDTTGGIGFWQWTPVTMYTNRAENIWGNNDGWAQYYWCSGWYECYFMSSQVWDYPYREWVRHSQGPGHNPAPGSGGTYPGEPGYYPQWNFRLSFEEFAKGIIYDTSAPQDTPYERIDYLTEAFYWDFEQVADYTNDQTRSQRMQRAHVFYDRMEPIWGNFSAKTAIKNPSYLPNEDTTLQEILNLGHRLDPVLIAAIARNNRPRARIIRRIGDD